MTLLEAARAGQVLAPLAAAARAEGRDPEELRRHLAAGRLVVPANPRHTALRPLGIGEGLRTKVNANLGACDVSSSLEEELVKLECALEAGADAVMDLSTGGDLDAIRRAIVRRSPVPVGTVPVYQAAVEAVARGDSLADLSPDDLFAVLERKAADGVDFMTVHCGITREALRALRSAGRVTGVVSRGGALMLAWMAHRGEENPFYAQYDRLLDLARRYEVTLSLGDALRPGSLADAGDGLQMRELVLLGELAERARRAGVQVMIEGPGHVPLHQIQAQVAVAKSVCRGAPLYVLGPLVTDVAPGYDHITAAIGGALAAMAGADFLCYVTPAEHLGLPSAAEVREGVMAARIAAHAADVAKGVPGAAEWDRRLSEARQRLDWEAQAALALDPARVREFRARTQAAEKTPGTCTMCGRYCAMKLAAEAVGRAGG
ncbi:MAG: phosphomethylpyrimidine synthase ThiC [Bacillota bacterium]|nr:phosphomethylpyrimidine synthase ThiC [Bacillota bacterium]